VSFGGQVHKPLCQGSKLEIKGTKIHVKSKLTGQTKTIRHKTGFSQESLTTLTPRTAFSQETLTKTPFN
jgi:hypothetical protein